jgi:hypothetical protein
LGIGLPEIFVIIAVLLLLVPLYLPFRFRRTHPERLWLGIALSLFSGTAQFYLPKNAWKFFLLCAGFFLVMKALVVVPWLVLGSSMMFNAGVMYYRFMKL